MSRRGFTLIEVVAAIVIIALGLIPVLETFVMGSKVANLRKDKTAVVFLLQRIMEEVKVRGFNTSVDSTGACSSLPECTGACADLKSCTYTITKVDYDLALQLKQIDVSVSWSPTGWAPQTEKVVTLITNR